jgi:hypothetical protein
MAPTSMYELVRLFAKRGMNVDVAPMPALSTRFRPRSDAFISQAGSLAFAYMVMRVYFARYQIESSIVTK